MKQKTGLVIFFIFLFVGCSSSLNNRQVNGNDLAKLHTTLSIIKNYYVGEIPQSDLENLNKKYNSKEDINNEIKKVLSKLDKYSIYIASEDTKKSILKKIKFKILDKKILYIDIPYFYKDTAKEIKNIINKNKTNANALILDLRNNPGGFFKEAIKTVDLFVNTGDIVSIKEKNSNGVRTYRASLKKTITPIPIVVLINKNTASSAEIVSGALKDLHRATLVGTSTFGKGTIQALIYITKDKKEAIKLTIAKYYFPNKKRLDNKIQPDILIKER
jgi:C-terminal processing protease CtpA/Prc